MLRGRLARYHCATEILSPHSRVAHKYSDRWLPRWQAATAAAAAAAAVAGRRRRRRRVLRLPASPAAPSPCERAVKDGEVAARPRVSGGLRAAVARRQYGDGHVGNRLREQVARREKWLW